jgi:hypothetical protein
MTKAIRAGKGGGNKKRRRVCLLQKSRFDGIKEDWY